MCSVQSRGSSRPGRDLTETCLGRVSMRFDAILICVLCSLEVPQDRVETSARLVSGGSRCVVMQFLRMFCEVSRFSETTVTRDFYNTKGGSRAQVRPLAELLLGCAHPRILVRRRSQVTWMEWVGWAHLGVIRRPPPPAPLGGTPWPLRGPPHAQAHPPNKWRIWTTNQDLSDSDRLKW